MHVRSEGPEGAPVLLFLHGGGVAGWMWDQQLARFATSFRVLVPDLPGHGRSAAEAFTTSAEIVDRLAARLDELSPGTEVTVIGFSFGAQLAIRLAVARPALVTRLVVVSALAEPVRFAGLSVWMTGLAAPLAGKPWFARIQARALFVPDELLDDYLRDAALVSRVTLQALLRENLAFRIPAGWSALPGAVLLLAGGAEPRALVRGMRALHEALPGSELELVAGAGHGLPLQRAEWFARRLGAWIAAHPA